MFLKELIYYLTYLSPLLLIFGVIIGVIRYPRLTTSYRILVYYIFAALIIDIGSRIYGSYYNNNLIFIPVFGLFELALFSILYTQTLLRTKHPLLLTTIGIGLGYIIYELVTVNTTDPKEFQTYSRVVDAFIIVLMSILFYLKKMNEDTAMESSLFALNTAILIYFSLHLIFILPINFLINENSHLKFYFWSVNLLMTLSFYTFIIHAIWKNGKTLKS